MATPEQIEISRLVNKITKLENRLAICHANMMQVDDDWLNQQSTGLKIIIDSTRNHSALEFVPQHGSLAQAKIRLAAFEKIGAEAHAQAMIAAQCLSEIRKLLHKFR